jgi:hypothetical protein
MTSKIFRLMLTGLGAVVALSGMVNLASAIVLLEPQDETSLGINLNVVKVLCVVAIICGVALAYFGLKKKK